MKDKKFDFKITLDEFFEVYYTHNYRLAISCKDKRAVYFLCWALFERGNKVNGVVTIEEWDYSLQGQVSLTRYNYLNHPIGGDDLVSEEESKQFGVGIIDFYSIDCTKYLLNNDSKRIFYGFEIEKADMIEASKKMYEERDKMREEIIMKDTFDTIADIHDEVFLK